jgi:hypothetical protein
MDTHFENAAVIMSLTLLPVQAPNTTIMYNSNQITFQIP